MPPSPETDEHFTRRALRLAMNGRGRVEPNPMVACVLVKHGQVIGEGYHQQFGGPHAEPNALASCTESPEGATAYVTLEPCCHTNKKTPPCAPRLIEAKIARLVIGCLDPNPDVNGKGVAMLRNAGIQVDGPVLEGPAKQLIAPFIARTVHHRPYVTLKWAQTADGKVAGAGGQRLQISNERSMRLVHELRSRSEAIAVGINTVLVDDPLLTARGIPTEQNSQALRVVLDRSLRISPTARLFTSTENMVPVRVYHGIGGYAERIRELTTHGLNLRALPLVEEHKLSLTDLLEDLSDEPTTHLLVEAGPTLAASFFRDNFCDRLWVFRSPTRAEDPSAPAAAPIPEYFMKTSQLDLGGDILTEYLNPHSPVFFSPEPSADFILAADQTLPVSPAAPPPALAP